ncbi:MAG TPA: hypothetical protein ENI96_13360 [Sedimenticola thiotaurini]|uniref:Surface antigen domain-containing protein n=1 Tax=Sedimenticola thiotaurini TaxID=1543721 RepID=A0A831RRF0_9GAMM|nr:hypothetical protein [Sedimenticola thiotaurini]
MRGIVNRSMGPERWSGPMLRLLLLLPLAAAIGGCVALPVSDGGPSPGAGAARVVPAPAVQPPVVPDPDQGILRRLGELESGRTYRIGGLQVVAAAPYYAASGRFCRRVEIRGGGRDAVVRQRLACRRDGTWSFSAVVFPGW